VATSIKFPVEELLLTKIIHWFTSATKRSVNYLFSKKKYLLTLNFSEIYK